MNWFQWFLVFIIVSTSWADVVIPVGKMCREHGQFREGEYIIECDEFTEARYTPEEKKIHFLCRDKTLKTFDLGLMKRGKSVEIVEFDKCAFSDQDNFEKFLGSIFDDISAVEEMIFTNSTNLSGIMTEKSLKNFKKLTSLKFTDTDMSNLSGKTFQNLPNLDLLFMDDNSIREFPPGFLNIPNLFYIKQVRGELTIIKKRDFENLQNLSKLLFAQNKIEDIEANAFSNNHNLLSIWLMENKLQSLPPGIFSDLPKLSFVGLSFNDFTADSFPVDLFRYNKMLEYVAINGNRLQITTLPNEFFKNLPKLHTVVMDRNKFENLPENLFWGCENLTVLNLQDNYLSTLPQNFFQDSKNLITLYLSKNKFESLPEEIFLPLRKLKRLYLAENKIKFLNSKHLTGLLSLETLDMKQNNLMQIDVMAFNGLRRLRFAYFSHNQLELKDNFYDLYRQSPFHSVEDTIEEIYLDHNNITGMFRDWTSMKNLKILDLNHNKISHLQAADLVFLSQRVEVDLTFNKIETVSMSKKEFEGWTEKAPHETVIDIKNNPINCNCKLYELLQYFEGKFTYQRNRFMLKIEGLTCHSPENKKGLVIQTLKSKNFNCQLEKKKLSCPSVCECSIRPSDDAFLVDCSNRQLREAPGPFNNPGHYVEMNLTGNFLKLLPSLKQQGYEDITILDLSNNNISSIDADHLSDILEELYLDNNNITELDGKVWERLENLTRIKHLALHDNDWKCDCETRELFDFIQHRKPKLPELQDVKCRETKRPIFSTTIEEFCPSDLYWIIGICVGIAIFGILIGGVSALYYRYQHEIKVWLYAHQWCLWFVTESELDKDKTYDAFISFSHKDEDFVMNELVPTLEKGPKPFKLCVHYRDWLAGEWIPQQIARSVDESRRTVVVLSPNFLESIWGKMEFRTAHNQALSDGRARVIVVLYGDIKPTDITDPELKAYLTMNTYVQWGDPWFWDKLRYAFPHSKNIKGKKNNIFENHQPIIQKANGNENQLMPQLSVSNSNEKFYK